MNIHFTDSQTFDTLQSATLAQVKMGAHLYGLADEHSDTDYLCITVPTANEARSFSFSHHQLQFKDTANNVDYIFINIFNFIRNTINGDSTINFEVIHSEELLDTPLAFLHEMKEEFRNFPIIRSYLGLARRDVKAVSKADGEREKNKTLMHAYRGYYSAKHIFEKTYSNHFPENIYQELKDLKKITDYKVRHERISHIKPLIDDYRKLVRTEMERGNITKFMSVEGQKLLDEGLSKLMQSKDYQDKIQPYLDLEPIYRANEFGIKY